MSIFPALVVAALAGQVADGNRYLGSSPTENSPAAPTPIAPQASEPTPAGTPASAGAAAVSGGVSDVSGATTEAPSAAPQTPPAVTADSTPQPDFRQPAPQATAPATAAESQKSVLMAGPKPSELIRGILKSPPNGQLAGTPMTLGDAVRDAKTRQDQTQRAKAYWDLSAAVADYHLAQLEEMELGVLRQGLRSPGKIWDVREAEAQARTDVARRTAQAAQLRLQQLLGRSSTGLLPLPADAPHCGRYNAEYEEIFGARPNPIAEHLSKLMPLRYDQLRTQAQAVSDAEAWRTSVRDHLNPDGDGAELLQAQDLLALRRRTFVATARDYNEEIAAYTELAAPAEVPADRLVAMMIRTSAPVGQTPWGSPGVEQATALQPIPQATPDARPGSGPASANAPQQTFGNGQQPREVRHSGPIQRLLNREHSILTNRPHLLRRVLGNQ